MADESKWRWEFRDFESFEEGRPVLEWFSALPDEAQDEICDLLGYLRVRTNSRWQRPSFDPLDGEGGISELRFDDVRYEQNGEIKQITCRIYGFFGPQNHKHSYTFLHGTNKKVRNDKNGKQIARERLRQLERNEATVHRFDQCPSSKVGEKS